MINYQVLKRKAVSQRVRELSCSQTDKKTDIVFYLRRSTGFASRSAKNWGAYGWQLTSFSANFCSYPGMLAPKAHSQVHGRYTMIPHWGSQGAVGGGGNAPAGFLMASAWADQGRESSS